MLHDRGDYCRRLLEFILTLCATTSLYCTPDDDDDKMCLAFPTVITGLIFDGTRNEFEDLLRLAVSFSVDNVEAPVFSHNFTSEVGSRAKLCKVAFSFVSQ